MEYVVTKASCHDRRAVEDVMAQLPHPYILGDKGYVSQALQEKLYRDMGLRSGHHLAKINARFHRKSGHSGCVENVKSWKPLFLFLSIHFVSLPPVLITSWV